MFSNSSGVVWTGVSILVILKLIEESPKSLFSCIFLNTLYSLFLVTVPVAGNCCLTSTNNSVSELSGTIAFSILFTSKVTSLLFSSSNSSI